MAGMVGVIADHAGRYTWFSQCLSALEVPAGTVTEWRTGANRGRSRDSLVQACLDDGFEWIFFIDDDQAFGSDVVTRLLSHNQPVVSALIVQRGAPFLPTAYVAKVDGRYMPLDLRSIVGDALVPCAGVGSGGLLVRSEVFMRLGSDRPWFLYTEEYGEDLYFSDRLNEAGIPIYVDTGCKLGHIIPSAVVPSWTGDRWVVGVQLADGTGTAIEMRH